MRERPKGACTQCWDDAYRAGVAEAASLVDGLAVKTAPSNIRDARLLREVEQLIRKLV